MKAIIAARPGGPEVMSFVNRPRPSISPADLLVKVHATAINRADISQRSGSYPLPPESTDIFGLEVAGEVIEVGGAANGWALGDRVCGLVPGGGHAEFAAVPATVALPVPANLTYVQAAAIPEAFLTAYDGLRRRGRIERGGWVLVHGGGSGVGTAAIQLARWWGTNIIVTCQGAKSEACLRLGATATIDYHEEDFVARVLELTSDRGVDVILDHIGGPYLERNLEALAMDGRLVVIGTMGGRSATFDLRALMRRRAWVTGSFLRPRTTDEKAQLVTELRKDAWAGFADGRLVPVVDRVLAWEQIDEAHRRMEQSDHVGKIVLAVMAE